MKFHKPASKQLKSLAIFGFLAASSVSFAVTKQKEAETASTRPVYAGLWQIMSTTQAQISGIGLGNASQCQGMYRQMASDGVLKIVVGLGYMDGTEETRENAQRGKGPESVKDPEAFSSIVSMLRSKCQTKNQGACGFKSRGENTFEKTITSPYTGQRMTVRVDIANGAASSVDVSNGDNKGNMTNAQLAQSQLARSVYFGGISAGADVGIYAGHARSGGGPDFYQVIASNGHVNYQGHYLRLREGIGGLQNSLSASAGQTKMVGIFACNADALFTSKVRQASRGPLVVATTRNLGRSDAYYAVVFAMIDSLVVGRCGSNFDTALRIGAGLYRDDYGNVYTDKTGKTVRNPRAIDAANITVHW